MQPTSGTVQHHENSGRCRKCLQILARYPSLDAELGNWFCDLQFRQAELHVSCAGRGKIEQEECFQRGASKAHYGQSAHNYNCALDLFQLKNGNPVWDRTWFGEVVGKNLTRNLKWYGAAGAAFYELPHVEVAAWRDEAKLGLTRLVE
jgi:hypothetical protein